MRRPLEGELGQRATLPPLEAHDREGYTKDTAAHRSTRTRTVLLEVGVELLWLHSIPLTLLKLTVLNLRWLEKADVSKGTSRRRTRNVVTSTTSTVGSLPRGNNMMEQVGSGMDEVGGRDG